MGDVVTQTKESSWLIPCVLMTIASGAFALALMPNHSGVKSTLQLLPFWMMIAAFAWMLFGPIGLVSMLRQRVKDPLKHMARVWVSEWRSILVTAIGMLIAGLNMITFMWTKPLLNQLVPFWADPMLAQLDYYLFLGRDPWTLLGWLNNMPMAIFYHRGWFALMIATLLIVFAKPASRERSAILISYFLLWTLAGPIIHSLVPATGPIFYAQMGYGDRFAAIPLPADMTQMANYLWTNFTQASFGPGTGISAMPSLHIATMMWMLIAVRILAPRWLPLMAAFGLLIFLLSISLGWHYAVDGLAGAAAAFGCYKLSFALLDPRAISRGRAVPAAAAEAHSA